MDIEAEHGEQPSVAQDSYAQAAAEGPAHTQFGATEPAHNLSDNGISHEAGDDEGDQPTVEHQAWLKQDDYWRRTTFIAATGRQTYAAPATRRLPRPNRFRKSSPVRSALILLLTLALIVLIPIGVMVAKSVAETHIKLPTSIPGLSLPTQTITPAPTTTVNATATPKKK